MRSSGAARRRRRRMASGQAQHAASVERAWRVLAVGPSDRDRCSTQAADPRAPDVDDLEHWTLRESTPSHHTLHVGHTAYDRGHHINKTGLARLSDDERRAPLGSRSLGRNRLRIGEDRRSCRLNYVLLDGDVVFRTDPVDRSSRPLMGGPGRVRGRRRAGTGWSRAERARRSATPRRSASSATCARADALASAPWVEGNAIRGARRHAAAVGRRRSCRADAAAPIGTFGLFRDRYACRRYRGCSSIIFLLLEMPFEEVTEWFRAPPDDASTMRDQSGPSRWPGVEGRLRRGAVRCGTTSRCSTCAGTGKLRARRARTPSKESFQLAPPTAAASQLCSS